jgi:hypothetical protein
LAQDFAIQNGGKCLSEGFISDQRDMEWECRKGHKWKQSFEKIKAKKLEWCPECCKSIQGHHKVVYTILDMQKLAEEKNGECLSEKYVNSKTALTWKCHLGHTWDAPLSTIRSGSWCRKCSTESGALKRKGKNHWTRRKDESKEQAK